MSLIREVVEDCSGLSRMELARTVCELIHWRRPNGSLKARECREFFGVVGDPGAYSTSTKAPSRPAKSLWSPPGGSPESAQELVYLVLCGTKRMEELGASIRSCLIEHLSPTWRHAPAPLIPRIDVSVKKVRRFAEGLSMRGEHKEKGLEVCEGVYVAGIAQQYGIRSRERPSTKLEVFLLESVALHLGIEATSTQAGVL